MKKMYTLKPNKEDKLIYIFYEIVTQSKEFGGHIPIKVLKNIFKKDKYCGITPKEVDDAISKMESTGVISYSKNKACVRVLG